MLMVFGYWKSAHSSWQGQGAFFGECFPFSTIKIQILQRQKKPQPQLGGLSFTWVKTSQLHPKLPKTCCKPEQGELTLPALALDYSHFSTRTCTTSHCTLTAALQGRGISRFLFPDSRHFSLHDRMSDAVPLAVGSSHQLCFPSLDTEQQKHCHFEFKA